MRNIINTLTVSILSACFCFGCGGGHRDESSESATRELTQNKVTSGTISSVGEVDWYHFRVQSSNEILRVKVTNNTYRADVDLLVTVYELDHNGEKVRLFADHAPEDSQRPTDIEMNIQIDTPKDIYVAVRDLMDDESSNNPYYISVDLSRSSEGNDTFADSVTVNLDDAQSCANDSIGYIGDVDSITFQVSQNGVYNVLTQFTPFSGGTDVNLNIKLYDQTGTLIDTLSQAQSTLYPLIRYLAAGQYYVLVEDYGRDHFDNASSYSVCVSSVDTDEANGNDQQSQSTPLAADTQGSFALSGSLDYVEDQDWYNLSLPSLTDPDRFQVLDIVFDSSANAGSQFIYQINVTDSNGNILLSHNHNAGSSAYQTQLRVGEGQHFINIVPVSGQNHTAAAPYSATIGVIEVDDVGESGEGNDTIDTAIVLASTSTASTGWQTGKIGFRGDEDWYAVTIDTSEYRVLEVFLETDSASLIEYYVSIMRDEVTEKLVDTNGSDGPTSLKAGLLVAPSDTAGSLTYYIKVSDYQGDDGDALNAYRIRTNVADVPSVIPTDSAISGSLIYHDEKVEQADNGGVEIELEHNSLLKKIYKVNNTHLRFNGVEANPLASTVVNGETTTITLPWIAGFIDYKGDQDWFQIDFEPLHVEGVEDDTEWYYDINVKMHVGNPGSIVEYVWKLYRDRGQNQIIVDRRTNSSDGFFASAGDIDTIEQGFDVQTPAADSSDEFWIGDRWADSFYFSVSDFNYVGSTLPDDDWDTVGVPYYFQITLTYHPGLSNPE